MTESQLPPQYNVFYLTDIDGVRLWGPPPKDIFRSIIQPAWGRERLLSPIQNPLSEKVGSKKTTLGLLAQALDEVNHAIRPTYDDSLEAARKLKQAAQTYKLAMGQGVLSGRGPHLHELTKFRIEDWVLDELIDPELIFLNPSSRHASVWKSSTVLRIANQGAHVIMVEDDPLAGIRMANQQHKVEGTGTINVHMVGHTIPYEWYLKRLGMQPPSNLHLSQTHERMTEKVTKQLQSIVRI